MDAIKVKRKNLCDIKIKTKAKNSEMEFNFIAPLIRSYADVKRAVKAHFGREAVIVEVHHYGDFFLLCIFALNLNTLLFSFNFQISILFWNYLFAFADADGDKIDVRNEREFEKMNQTYDIDVLYVVVRAWPPNIN